MTSLGVVGRTLTKQGGQAGSDDAATLKAEIKRLREENEILKKAAIFFARESS